MVEDGKADYPSFAFADDDILLRVISYCINIVSEIIGEMFIKYQRLA